MTLISGERRHYRCPECGSQNIRLFAMARVLVDISDQPAASCHFDHNLDAFSDRITDGWYIEPSAFVCEECDYESPSWHTNADALKTAVEWSEVSE